MPKIGKHRKDREARERMALTVKKRLALLIAVLLAIVLILTFRVGNAWWPAWLSEYRVLLRGVLLFSVVLVFLLSPIIVEANSNPRTLSGPGKWPGGPPTW